MIRKAIALVAMPLLLLVLLPSSSLSITSGWPAQEKEDFQSVVQIWTIEDNKFPKFLCTGVVIAPDTVLTAASCIHTKEGAPKATTLFISTAPKLDFKMPLDKLLKHVSSIAKKGVNHPKSDLMLIFLKQHLNVEPALLFSSTEVGQIRVLSQVLVSGYGFSGAEPKKTWKWSSLWSSDKSKQQGEKIVAKSQIVEVKAEDLFLANLPEDGAACLGDEGAPIFAHIDTPFTNSQRLVGMFISGPGLATCAKPSAALRLDAFRDFINDTMVKECQKKERLWCAVEGLLVPGYDEHPQIETPPPFDDPIPPSPPPSRTMTPSTETEPEADDPPPKPEVKPETKSEPSAKTPPKSTKRRLNVTAEGAGCSCQQVPTQQRD